MEEISKGWEKRSFLSIGVLLEARSFEVKITVKHLKVVSAQMKNTSLLSKAFLKVSLLPTTVST